MYDDMTYQQKRKVIVDFLSHKTICKIASVNQLFSIINSFEYPGQIIELESDNITA